MLRIFRVGSHVAWLAAALVTTATSTCCWAQTLQRLPANTSLQSPDPVKFPTGALDPTPEELAHIPFQELTRAYIPEAIDLGSSFPVPGHQKYGSCTAWATGYAARSYYARSEAGKSNNDPDNIPSPAYIFNRTYNRAKTCETAGSSVAAALDLLASTGAPSLKDYAITQTCDLSSPLLTANVGKFRIAGHSLVGGRNTTRPLNIDIIRQMLAQGHPVLVSMKVDDGFSSLRPTEVYGGIAGATKEQLEKLTGHAIALVGYDDRRRAMRFINSWGTDWGDGGFGWMSYEALLGQVMYAHTMKTSTPPPRPSPSRPDLAARMPDEIKKVLQDEQCALVEESSFAETTASGDSIPRPRFTGFVAHERDRLLIERYAAANKGRSEVKMYPWPLCEASLHLRSTLRAPSRPTVTTVSGNTTLKVGEHFALKIKAPDIPMFLYAYYLEDDGTIVNLLPRRGPLREMTPAGAEILLGDGQVGRPTFRVTPLKTGSGRDVLERGHEAVIVIGSRAPVDELEAEETGRSPRAQVGNLFRHPAEAAVAGISPERILLAKLKDISSRRESETMLQREVSADLLQLKITE